MAKKLARCSVICARRASRIICIPISTGFRFQQGFLTVVLEHKISPTFHAPTSTVSNLPPQHSTACNPPTFILLSSVNSRFRGMRVWETGRATRTSCCGKGLDNKRSWEGQHTQTSKSYIQNSKWLDRYPQNLHTPFSPRARNRVRALGVTRFPQTAQNAEAWKLLAGHSLSLTSSLKTGSIDAVVLTEES